MTNTEQIVTPAINPKWPERFTFCAPYRSPQTPAAEQALKQLPNQKRRLISFNWTTFFFGLAYFFTCSRGKFSVSRHNSCHQCRSWIGIYTLEHEVPTLNC